jgi:hypothetical protein
MIRLLRNLRREAVIVRHFFCGKCIDRWIDHQATLAYPAPPREDPSVTNRAARVLFCPAHKREIDSETGIQPVYLEVFLRGLSVSEHRRISAPAQARVSASSHTGFSRRRGVLRPLFRTPYGLLRYQRSSACFRPVCLSSTCLSLFCRSDWLANPITCASFSSSSTHLFADSLDSEL